MRGTTEELCQRSERGAVFCAGVRSLDGWMGGEEWGMSGDGTEGVWNRRRRRRMNE